MQSETWRCALQIVGQLPDNRKAALMVLRAAEQLVHFIYDSSEGRAQAASGGGSTYPSLTCIGKDNVSTFPNITQSDDTPGKV